MTTALYLPTSPAALAAYPTSVNYLGRETHHSGIAAQRESHSHLPRHVSSVASSAAAAVYLPSLPVVPAPTLSVSPPVRRTLANRFDHPHHPTPPHPLPLIHSASVIDTFKKVLADVDIDECEPAGENAFLVCDLKRVYDRYILWQRELGDRVEAFFAVKCNPDPVIIQMMARLGLGFDCASHAEIANVLSYGVSPNKIIYANPCKASSFIRHAAKHNVQMMTFDNADELIKVARFFPRAKMVLRILTDDSGSLCKLGLKFGAPLSEVRGLLEKARELDIDVVGISFHVGSGCTNPDLFGDAVERARWAFDVGKELGFHFDLLDVGGGFGGDNFVRIAAVLREAIALHFPKEDGVRIIAEPGRYFVSEAFEMATNIIARRGKAAVVDDDGMTEEEPIVMYYVNDGVYGAFNCTMFDHQVVHPLVLTMDGSFVSSPSAAVSEDELEACSVWGPTCDSIDCVSKLSYLPTARLVVGDWLRWESMGAYTICAASQFNGFKQAKVIYTIDADPFVEAQIRHLLH